MIKITQKISVNSDKIKCFLYTLPSFRSLFTDNTTRRPFSYSNPNLEALEVLIHFSKFGLVFNPLNTGIMLRWRCKEMRHVCPLGELWGDVRKGSFICEVFRICRALCQALFALSHVSLTITL